MQITFGIGNDAAEPREGEMLGFVFTCPNCHTPVSYQANEDHAVELDKKTFDNFQEAIKRKTDEQQELEAVALTKQNEPVAVARVPMTEDIFSAMLKDIRECDSYDEFLKRI
jgi:hypothetical protein